MARRYASFQQFSLLLARSNLRQWACDSTALHTALTGSPTAPRCPAAPLPRAFHSSRPLGVFAPQGCTWFCSIKSVRELCTFNICTTLTGL